MTCYLHTHEGGYIDRLFVSIGIYQTLQSRIKNYLKDYVHLRVKKRFSIPGSMIFR